MPIWVGGSSAASLRRAAELSHGWMPFGMAMEDVAALLATVELPERFEVVLSATADPQADPDGVRDHFRRLRDTGVSAITCTLRADSAQHYCDQLARLRDLGGM
jgi:alkanesulfonate monooxygenase SsuD/methylene tetrahydromethanopterin reductase-like flavin-dependent oxidoreductase (luciferase family)